MISRVAVTGPNGAIGQAVLRRAHTDFARSLRVVAAVRSERAEKQLPVLENLAVTRIDYALPETLTSALAGARAMIHLPGVLVERRDASYEHANVDTTRVAVLAAKRAGLEKLVLVSAFGAAAGAKNRFFRTKGQAEDIVRESGLAYTILRVPLVLGPRTAGSKALARRASRKRTRLPGGGHNLKQPLDVDDLALAALRSATERDLARGRTLELAGPESLPERELVERAARMLGHEVRIGAVPLTPLRWLLTLKTKLFGPGFSPDALDVILADDTIDPQPAAQTLGIALTPVDVMIRKGLG